jgi:hypothetical protein
MKISYILDIERSVVMFVIAPDTPILQPLQKRLCKTFGIKAPVLRNCEVAPGKNTSRRAYLMQTLPYHLFMSIYVHLHDTNGARLENT